MRERDRLEDVGVDRRIVFRWFFKEWDGIVDFIDLAQYRDRHVNAVMNFRVS